MAVKNLRASAKMSPAMRTFRGITPAQAIEIADCEVRTLRAWIAVDPDTPMLAECAARLADLARVMGTKQ